MDRFDRFHFEHPSFGSRRLGVQFGFSRAKAKRLMQLLHIEATYPNPQTSTAHHDHKKYPYLLRNFIQGTFLSKFLGQPHSLPCKVSPKQFF
jgi:hypothetical protein